jgi:YegS/Rv2252/BmrU family lipid kinase
MSSPCTIILNAKAGALSVSLSVEQVQQMAEEIGLEAHVLAPTSIEEMMEMVHSHQAPGARIAVAGGDGTVARVVQELAHGETILGILPQGTFNNFATALRLPMDLPSALRVLKDGMVQEVSLGKIETDDGQSRYFAESAGVGLFADALALYGEGTNKNFWRGLKAMTRVVASFEARRLRLEVDGQVTAEHAVMCLVANTYRTAQAIPVAPEARLTDDELDVIIVGDLKRGELLKYYRAFRAQVHLKMPKVTALRGKTIRLQSQKHLNAHCDDSIVGSTPATITVQPRALKVLVDRL